jgi:hypothetical protein
MKRQKDVVSPVMQGQRRTSPKAGEVLTMLRESSVIPSGVCGFDYRPGSELNLEENPPVLCRDQDGGDESDSMSNCED